jgi:phenylpropionate dioxygenase-like ring-hydroxylating dioxygenase large terminal subunit
MGVEMAGKPESALKRWPRYDQATEGLREYWYPVLESRRLGSKMVALKIAGQEICLVRENGKAHALENRCPHRGIPLSMGSREFPGHVACIYHGWVFDVATGELKAALPDGPHSSVVGQVCVRTFPVEERIGMIWVWTGEGEPVPVEEDIPEELFRPEADIFWRQKTAKGNWRYAAENGFDESHGKMLHRPALWLFFNRMSAWNETEIKRSTDGKWLSRFQNKIVPQDDYPGIGRWPRWNFFQERRKGIQQGSNDHSVDIRMPATLRVRQPGNANWTHYEWYIPIDADHYRYTQVAVSWVTGFKRLVWWMRYWIYILLVHHIGFNNQDLSVVPLQSPDIPEYLFRPDISVTAWRRFVDKQMRTPTSPAGKPDLAPSDTSAAAE